MADKRTFLICALAGYACWVIILILLLVYPLQMPSDALAYLPPALALQFAMTPGDVMAVYGFAGTPERLATVQDMRNGNLADYGFMVFYGLFLSLFFHGQALKMKLRAWWTVIPMIAVAIVFNIFENGVMSQITAAPDAPNITVLLNEVHLYSWGKWSTLAVVSGVAAMSFFARGAMLLGVLCLPPLIMVLPAYEAPGRLAVFLVLGVGLSWAVMLAHATKRAFFQPQP